jgi:phage shock protein PspC (stress-responsive transcriptional regulator)
VQPVFFVTAGLFFVIGLGLVYYAWWRMPPDSTR